MKKLTLIGVVIAAIVGLVSAAVIGIAAWWPAGPPTVDQAEIRQLERTVISRFSELHGEVAGLERATFYLHEGQDAWQREMESIQRELAELESVNNPESD